MGQPKKKKVRALYHYREVIRIVISPMHVALSAFPMCQNYWSKKLANNSSKWIAHWIKILKINKELKRKAKRIPLHIFLQSASYPHPHVELLCHQERQTPVILFYFFEVSCVPKKFKYGTIAHSAQKHKPFLQFQAFQIQMSKHLDNEEIKLQLK